MDGDWHLYQPGQRWRRPGHQARAVLTTRLVGHLSLDLLKAGLGWRRRGACDETASRTVEIGKALLDQRIMAGSLAPTATFLSVESCRLLSTKTSFPVCRKRFA